MITLFTKLFGRKVQKIQGDNSDLIVRVPECSEIQELGNELQQLLSKNHYVARSEYIGISKYQKVVEYFTVLDNSGMLESFCVQNQIISNEIRETLFTYKSLIDNVNQANDEFIKNALISEEDYLDSILKLVDPQIKLDEDQRKAILTDEDYCLVIAGAGAGKTTTVAAKVKYLVEKRGINRRETF